MYNYFPHPSNARQSSMCVTLLVNEGFAGYGLYWAIIELLRDAPNYKYTADEKLLAYVLHAPDAEQVKRVIKNFGLFVFDDDGLMFSPWLLESLGSYDEQKKKLQEAGRKGAARRWARAHGDNGQAIDTPLMDNGQAIAYNPTKSNVSEQNLTQPNHSDRQGLSEVLSSETHKISEEYYLAAAERKDYEGGQAYLLQECYRRGLSIEAFHYLLEHTDNGNTDNSTYRVFCLLCKRVDSEKYPVKYPDNFYLRKIFG